MVSGSAKGEEKEKKRKAPYGAIKWYDDFFNLLGRVQIEKVDSKLLSANEITKGSNVYAVINGLRFLDLIDDKGNSTARMNGLRVVGDEYQKNFRKMIEEAYSDLIGSVELQKALPDDVVNTFITSYDMPRSTASMSAKLFVFLAQKAGIPLSKEIIEGLTVSEQSSKGERKPKKKKIEQKSKRTETKERKETLSEEVLARFTLKDVGYVDVKDKDTYQIAKAYLQLLSKKLGLTEEE